MRPLKAFGLFVWIVVVPVHLVQLGLVARNAFELRARRENPSLLQQRAAKKLGKPFDTRRRSEIIEAARKRGEELVPAVPPSLFWRGQETLTLDGKPALPLAGISSARTIYCNESGEYLVYQSDELGFANPPGLVTGPVDVALVGDSFAQGACVPSADSAAAVLRRTFPRTVSIGYADSGPLAETATLRELGPRLKPKTVVWLYYEGNDIDDLTEERKSPLLAPYLERPDFRSGIADRQREVDAVLRVVAERWRTQADERKPGLLPASEHWERLKLADFLLLRPLRLSLRLIPEKYPRGPVSWEHPELPLFRRLLTEARGLAAGWGGKVLFVYLPEWGSLALPEFMRGERDRILKAAADAGLEVVDVLPRFRAHPKPASLFPFGMPGHYTSEGYQLVAQLVSDHLAPTRP